MSNPDPDVIIPEAAEILAALGECLCNELRTTIGGQVCWCGLWHGEDTPTDVCDACDDNHCGMAWVRLVLSFPSDTFPLPAIDQYCGKPLAYQIEMGVARCWPTPEDGAFPEPDEAGSAILDILSDHDAMRRAALCCADEWMIWLEGYSPFNSGGCAGGTWTVFAGSK